MVNKFISETPIINNINNGIFIVCYNHRCTLCPFPSIADMKCLLYNKEETDAMSITELFNCCEIRGRLLKPNLLHIHPDNSPLPLHYHTQKIRSYHNVFNKDAIQFDNTDVNIPPVNIKLQFGKLLIGGIEILDGMLFGDKPIMDYINVLWRKGYFLTSHGQHYYDENSILLKSAIKPPDWFTLESSSPDDLFRFIDYNFCEYLPIS